MAENHVSKRLPIARKSRRHRVDEGLVVRFLCHANSTHVLQTLWRGLHKRRGSRILGNPHPAPSPSPIAMKLLEAFGGDACPTNFHIMILRG